MGRNLDDNEKEGHQKEENNNDFFIISTKIQIITILKNKILKIIRKKK